MREAAPLFLVLGLLYVAECLVWVGRRSVLFDSPWWRRWRVVRGSSVVGNAAGGAGLLNPLPPLGLACLAHGLPVSVSPHGVCDYHIQTMDGAARGRGSGRVLTHGEVDNVANEGRHLVVNGERFALCASAGQARCLAGLVRGLAAAPPHGRESAVREFIAARLSVEAAHRRLGEAVRWSRPVRWCCLALLAYLFAAAPALVASHGLDRVIIPGAVAMFVGAAVVAAVYAWAHRRLHGAVTSDMIGHAVRMVVCPPDAMRAHDRLTLEAMEQFHPLLLAQVMHARGATELAGHVVRDLTHPLPHGLENPAAAAVVDWFAAAELEACKAMLEADMPGTVASLLGEPPWDGQSSAYCPRCLGQLTSRADECPDCPGVRLKQMAVPAGAD